MTASLNVPLRRRLRHYGDHPGWAWWRARCKPCDASTRLPHWGETDLPKEVTSRIVTVRDQATAKPANELGDGTHIGQPEPRYAMHRANASAPPERRRRGRQTSELTRRAATGSRRLPMDCIRPGDEEWHRSAANAELGWIGTARRPRSDRVSCRFRNGILGKDPCARRKCKPPGAVSGSTLRS